MIPKGEGRHYIAVKILPALLRGTASKNHGNLYYLNCIHFIETKIKL